MTRACLLTRTRSFPAPLPAVPPVFSLCSRAPDAAAKLAALTLALAASLAALALKTGAVAL